MAETNIEPHRITKPIQLLAVWFSALVLIDSAFLIASAKIATPAWIAPMLSIAAVTFVPVFLLAVFLMQTIFRPQLQDDSHYSDWLKRREKMFHQFSPENQLPKKGKIITLANEKPVFSAPEERRIEIYKKQSGLFLVHDWRPSETEGQIADIVIWLHQHDEGPFSAGTVDRVEYYLGPTFFDKPMIKKNEKDAFKLEISAYGPVLCLALVYLKGAKQPIELTRYIDFEEIPE